MRDNIVFFYFDKNYFLQEFLLLFNSFISENKICKNNEKYQYCFMYLKLKEFFNRGFFDLSQKVYFIYKVENNLK